jgi:N-acetylglucosamine malate deacetylase 1
MITKLDILAFGAHPDDVELGCAGTLHKHVKLGLKVGIVDLTLGEMGTRGTVEIRLSEALNAKEVMGAHIRENLKLPDGFIDQSIAQKMQVIQIIRKYRPEIVITNAPTDRHPDHGNGHKLVHEAAFLSGLAKIESFTDGEKQEHWRPKSLLSYIQDKLLIPDFIVDTTNEWDIKKEAIFAHKSQFYSENGTEPQTYISSKNFISYIQARDQEFGRMIGCNYGEGFISAKKLKVGNLLNIIPEIF